MLTINDMRRFTSVYRLQGLSTKEIAGKLDEFAHRVRDNIKYRNRVLKQGALLNALALWFLELDEPHRIAMTREIVGRLEEFMADGPANAADGANGKSHEVEADGDPRPARKRKSG